MDEDVAAVIVQYPNFFGGIEPLKEIEEIAMKINLCLLFQVIRCSWCLTPPGKFGADIVIGDAQPFGIPTAFGGPHCGYFAVTNKLMRKIPGRLVGQTTDEEGRRGFVLNITST